MSLDKFMGHCTVGRTTVQQSPTALIIDSNLGYVFRSTPMSKWIWIQEGSLPRHSYAWGSSSGDACWVATGFLRVPTPFFVAPSFAFKHTFWVGLLGLSDNLSQDGQDYHIQKKFDFSFDTSWPCQNKWYTQQTDLPLHLCLRFLLPLQLKTLPLLPPSDFTLESSSASLFPTVVRSSSESMIALQPLGGKQIP